MKILETITEKTVEFRSSVEFAGEFYTVNILYKYDEVLGDWNIDGSSVLLIKNNNGTTNFHSDIRQLLLDLVTESNRYQLNEY